MTKLGSTAAMALNGNEVTRERSLMEEEIGLIAASAPQKKDGERSITLFLNRVS